MKLYVALISGIPRDKWLNFENTNVVIPDIAPFVKTIVRQVTVFSDPDNRTGAGAEAALTLDRQGYVLHVCLFDLVEMTWSTTGLAIRTVHCIFEIPIFFIGEGQLHKTKIITPLLI